MTAKNFVILILLGFLSLPSYTQSADVIIATVRHQDVVEVPQANRAVVFVYVSFLPIFFIFSSWILIDPANVVLLVNSWYSYFVAFFKLLDVLLINLLHDSLLLVYVILVDISIHDTWYWQQPFTHHLVSLLVTMSTIILLQIRSSLLMQRPIVFIWVITISWLTWHYALLALKSKLGAVCSLHKVFNSTALIWLLIAHHTLIL